MKYDKLGTLDHGPFLTFYASGMAGKSVRTGMDGKPMARGYYCVVFRDPKTRGPYTTRRKAEAAAKFLS